MERNRIKKPNQERFGSELSEYYLAKELYVGSRVNFHNHMFILIDADEYAFHYMEKHPGEVSVVIYQDGWLESDDRSVKKIVI